MGSPPLQRSPAWNRESAAGFQDLTVMVGLVGGQPGRSAQQTRQQGNQSDADQGNTTARDELCHSFIEVEYKNFYRNGNLRYC